MIQMLALTSQDQQERLCICYWRTTSSFCKNAPRVDLFDLHSKQLLVVKKDLL